jgi:glycosyltransferase involved in cell wall biosynthesis
LTATIIARDEATRLAACLEGLRWADERLVLLDSRTRDRSAEVARQAGADVDFHEFVSFPRQRNAALDLVRERYRSDWLLFVDADERLTAPFATEVRQVIQRTEADAPVGYWIPRRNYIWGEWIRHGGWSPDYQLRLLKVGAARYDETRDVHELVELAGPPGYLHEPFIHYNYDQVSQFIRKQSAYARLDAIRLSRRGIKVRPHAIILQPIREFRRRYLWLEGYRDGWRGLLLCSLLAWYTAVTYAEVVRLRRTSTL